MGPAAPFKACLVGLTKPMGMFFFGRIFFGPENTRHFYRVDFFLKDLVCNITLNKIQLIHVNPTPTHQFFVKGLQTCGPVVMFVAFKKTSDGWLVGGTLSD